MKKRRLLALLSATFFLLYTLAACSIKTSTVPEISDPTEIVKKSIEKMKDVQSLHMKLDLSGKMSIPLTGEDGAGPTEISASADVDYIKDGKKLKGKVSIKSEAISVGDIELIMIGDKAWVKMMGKWTKSDSTSGPNIDLFTPENEQKLLDSLKDLSKLSDEKVDDVDCYHLKATADPSKLTDMVPSASPAADIKNSSFEMWVGKEDLYTRKMYVMADSKDGKITVTISMSKFNEVSIKIEPPPVME